MDKDKEANIILKGVEAIQHTYLDIRTTLANEHEDLSEDEVLSLLDAIVVSGVVQYASEHLTPETQMNFFKSVYGILLERSEHKGLN